MMGGKRARPVGRITAIAALLLFGLAAPCFASERSWLLPASITDTGDKIDALFWAVFAITGVVFVGTEGLLLLFIVKYRKREGRKAFYTHGNHKLEVIWTIIPAIILAALAFVQFGLWTDLKDPAKFPIDDPDAFEVHVLGKQFAWAFRYAGPDGEWGTKDDFTDGQLYVPKDRPVILRLRSIDVIHSFYVPVLRFKQDLVPGMTITGWFEARESGSYEIACAELCGASHYTMRGELQILEPADFDAFYVKKSKELAPIDYESGTEFFRFWPIEEIVESK